MSELKPENLKEIVEEKEKKNNIEYMQLTENSLKNIDELNKLFPKWNRQSVLKKIQKTVKGNDLRFVARMDGTIIAHVKILPKKSIHEHIAEITSLIVDKEFRKQGIGIKLMKFTLSKLPKKIRIVTLAVDSKNKKAINLYKKIGFKQYGLLKNGSKIDGNFINNYFMYKKIK